jgi:hypothetical protein
VYDDLSAIGVTPTATTVRTLMGPALARRFYDRVLALWASLQGFGVELESSDVHAAVSALICKA